MATREALIANVIANPHDDWPRLLFADWCEEHGKRERAELIRVGVEINKLQEESEPDKYWLPPKLERHLDDWSKHRSELFKRFPIVKVELTFPERNAIELFGLLPIVWEKTTFTYSPF